MHAYGAACTYSASCSPTGHAEELGQVLQIIGSGVIHDAGAMAMRILVAIELADGALGGITRRRGVVRGPSSLLLLMLLLEIAILRWTGHCDLCNISAVCKIGCGVTRRVTEAVRLPL